MCLADPGNPTLIQQHIKRKKVEINNQANRIWQISVGEENILGKNTNSVKTFDFLKQIEMLQASRYTHVHKSHQYKQKQQRNKDPGLQREKNHNAQVVLICNTTAHSNRIRSNDCELIKFGSLGRMKAREADQVREC